MTRLRLVLRTLRYYRASNIALALGVAVATAVLTGSLLVGESVRGSLVSGVERRLGEVDHVVTARGSFPASLGERLQNSELFRRDFARAEPVIVARGSCVHSEAALTANRVAIYGSGDIAPGTCVVSEALAEALAAEHGATVALRTSKTGDFPLHVPIAAEAGELALLRVKVVRVAPPTEMKGAFSLYGTQRAQRNCWVRLGELAEALGLPGRANALFVTARDGARGRGGARSLLKALNASASLADLGLKVRFGSDGALVAESDRILIAPELERRLLAVPGRKLRVFAYLADTVRDERSGAEFPYSTVAGVDWPAVAGELPDGPIPAGGIVLNRWAADDLNAGVGDRIAITFSVRDDSGLVGTGRHTFRLARVIETKGPGADATLVPEFEGITDAESLADWDPPREFGFRAERIRPKDEEYWKRFRAAPKAFIGTEDARALWGTALGRLTSVRYYGTSRRDLEAALRAQLEGEDADPSSTWNVRPIRAELMASASGSTDFGQLFLGLSFFIVAAAALLVALLMRLYVEQRARQAGTLSALGFTRSAVRGLFAAEGLLVAVSGSLVGVAAGVGYSWLMIAALRTLWVGAVGTSHIELHINLHAGSSGVGIGFAAGLVVSSVAILQGVRRVEAASLSSAMSAKRAARAGGALRSGAAAAILAVCAVGLVIASLAGPALNTTAVFFGAGACLLAALALGWRAWFVRQGDRRVPGFRSLPALALRNASRNPTRSTLTIALLAAAAFITVAVGSMRTSGDFDPSRRDGPSGGYSLVVDFDVPLPYDISLPEGRRLLALGSPRDETDVWKRVEIASLRAGPGEDVSCRNLYTPTAPRVMSVPDRFIAEGAFSFVSALDDRDNEWELLRAGKWETAPAGTWTAEAVPVIADYAAARWIIHKELGEAVSVGEGRGRRGRIVALLENSIFQSELLVSEETFRELYPGRSGFSRLLVRASAEDAGEVARELRRALADFGVTVETARERMASFAEVANSYISAFQALGGLGFLLGSVGLIVVLARGVVERRSEIALLGAVGFGRRRIVMLFAAENVLLLAAGTLSGAASAAVAVAPEFARSGTVARAGLTLAVFCGIVLIVSMALACACALLVRDVSPAALRRE